MSDFEWNTSLGGFIIFIIVLLSITLAYGLYVLIKNMIYNYRERQYRDSLTITYVPDYDEI